MSRRPSRRAAARRPNTALREGVYDSAAIDPDEHLYRSLTGGPRGDHLPPYQRSRANRIAHHLFRTNPVANRFMTLLTDFVLGESVTVSSDNAAVREVVDRHWNDTYNDWDRAMPDLFQSYMLYGELLLPLFFSPVDGHLRVGMAQPERIDTVDTDPENWRIVTSVQLTAQGADLDGPRYTIVNRRSRPDELLAATRPALFWTRGDPLSTRGLSVLYPMADFIDLLDQLLFSEVERWLLLKAFVWDVTVTGDERAVGEVARINRTPPPPGSVNVHNDKIAWEAKSPALDSADSVTGIRFLRNHVLGAGGIPEMWYAEGGDVNRAVGAVMAEVPRKRLTALQNEWRHIMQDIMQAQIDAAVATGMIPARVPREDSEGNPTDDLIDARAAVHVHLPDLSGDDSQQVATTLQALTSTLVLAENQSYVTKDTARQTFLSLLTQFGVDFDPEQEARRIEEELAAAAKQQQPPPPPYAAAPPATLTALAALTQQQQQAQQQQQQQAQPGRRGQPPGSAA